jgi:putative ABC transport system permease protein
MKAYDLLELAGRNLREAVGRNSLTTMGISVGVASLVAMLSLGVGLQRLAGRQLGRSGLFDTVIVYSKQDFRSDEDRRSDRKSQPNTFKTLDDAARADFRKLPGVVDVYPDIRLMAEMRFAQDKDGKIVDTPHFTFLSALPASASDSEAFDDLQGKFFSDPMAHEVIILSGFGRELLGLPDQDLAENKDPQKLTPQQANSLLGKDITLRYAERENDAQESKGQKPAPAKNKTDESSPGGLTDDAVDAANMGQSFGFTVVRKEIKLKIVGVVEKEPYGGMRGGARGRVFIPTPLAESLNMIQPNDLRTMMRPAEGKSYFTLVVRVGSSSKVKGVQDAIKKQGYSTFSIFDASNGLKKFFLFLDLFLAIFGSLALAVASLGIINTLVMAVLERRREIGIMKAIGASDFDVKNLFFVEAGVMGAMGGLLGTALGWVIGRAINFGTNVYLRRQDMTPESFWYVPFWLVIGAFTFAVVVSLVSGFYPASRAARLDPVQSLRHD